LLVWLALLLITVLRRLPVLVQPQAIDDEVNYALVAQELLAGGDLYVDAVERRPPLTFWVYAAVFRLFGGGNWLALHAAGVVWVLLTMVALHAIAARLFGRRAGIVAALLYSVFQPWWYWGDLAFNGEVLMNLPIAAAYALALRREPGAGRALAAGALLAAALLLKQPAAIAILPLAWYLSAVQRRQWIAVSWLGAGVLLVIAPLALWLASEGRLDEAVYWSVLDHDVPHVFWDRAAERTLAFAIVCLPIIVASGWALRRPGIWDGRSPERIALLALAAVSAVGTAASGRFFPHYYIGILLPLVLLAAPGVQSMWRAATRGHRPALAGCIWLLASGVAGLAAQSARGASLPRDTEAGRFVRQHAASGDRLFVWGRDPRIYLDSRRRPAARYIDTFALTGRIFGPELPGVDTQGRVVPEAWAQLRDDFVEHPPRFIVDTQTGAAAPYPVSRFPWLQALLQMEYTAVADVAEGRIYRRVSREPMREPALLAAAPGLEEPLTGSRLTSRLLSPSRSRRGNAPSWRRLAFDRPGLPAISALLQ
jgi:4-amino-4-deoxy-L-arabinose transferase-like glycosyltransferase